MVVKSVAFVVVAVLVAVAAGTGAYLAIRDNREPAVARSATAALGEPSQSGNERPPFGVVDATEEIIAPESKPEVTVGQSPPPSTESAARVEAQSQYAPSTPPVPSDASSVPESSRREHRATSSSDSSRSSTDGEPEVDGWERVAASSSSSSDVDTELIPERVALSTIDSTTLGSTVDPEERPRFVRELIVSADSVIGLQVDTPVSTEDAEVEDNVEARVTRDVVVDNEIAIPAGAQVLGSVVLVEHAGQLKGSARLGVRFHTVVLDDLYELPIATETVYREGRGRGSESAAKIGGAAVGGAILGAIFGGRQGAAIGSAAGAAGGTAAAMAGDGQPATFPAGSTLTVRLSQPATVTIEY